MPFLSRGFEVTGCDISPAMLAEAARKAPEATLFSADLRDLGRIGCFDLITCFDDSLNYLLDEQELARALRCDRGEPGSGRHRPVRPQHAARLPKHLRRRQCRGPEWDGVRVARRIDRGRRSRLRGGGAIDVFTHRADGLYERIPTRARPTSLPARPGDRTAGACRAHCLSVYGARENGALDPDSTKHDTSKPCTPPDLAKGGDAHDHQDDGQAGATGQSILKLS